MKSLLKKFFGKRCLYEFHMKSGNSFKCWLRDLNITYRSQDITEIEWKSLSNKNRPLFFINLAQIEHVALLKIRGFIN